MREIRGGRHSFGRLAGQALKTAGETPALQGSRAGATRHTARLDVGVILVAMSTAKRDVEQLLNKLPDNCSVEDIQYHLYVLDKVRRGLDDAEINGALSSDEVEARLGKWLSD